MRRRRAGLLVCASLCACAAGKPASGGADDAAPYRIELPAHFPPLPADPDAPFSRVEVELGRHLFYDRHLSQNDTQSCASCHRQELAFTDGRTRAIGSTGQTGPRNTPSLANAAYMTTLTWANPLLRHLSQQALVPMFGDRPVELGLTGNAEHLLDALHASATYTDLFGRAYPNDADPISLAHVTRALTAFERTLISADSAYDHYLEGDTTALDTAQVRGMQLFFSQRLGCGGCHTGFDLSDGVEGTDAEMNDPDGAPFHNTGLYNLDDDGGYPDSTGLFAFTGQPSDMGRFRTPSLRNIAVTAPYMHDGSIATLDEVLDHYAQGGRTIASGPDAGVGSANPHKSPRVTGFTLASDERSDLLAFLQALTDSSLLDDPRFSDPWGASEEKP